MACTNGSRRQSGAPTVGYIPINAGTDDSVSRAVRALGLAPTIPIDNVDSFCSSPPPTPVDFVASDWFNPTVLLTKLSANAKAYQWNQWCECIPSPPPSPGGCSSVVYGSGVNVNGCVSLGNYGNQTYPGIVTFVSETRSGCPGKQLYVNGIRYPDDYFYYPDVIIVSSTCPGDDTPPTPPEPPVYPPDLPEPPDTPMNPADKAELLDAIRQCYCTPGDGSEPLDLTEIIEILTQIRDETIPQAKEDIFDKIEDQTPEYLLVKVTVTNVPNSATIRVNADGPRRINAGWIIFQSEGVSFPREYINFDESIFVSPVPGESVSYQYFLDTGYTADFALKHVKFDKEAEIT